MALDFGLRRLGVANGDTLTRTAHPLASVAVSQGAPDWKALDRLVGDWSPARFVVGIPYNAAGLDGPLTPLVREFARAVFATHPVNLDPEAARAAGYADVVAPTTFPIVVTAATRRSV